MAVIPEGRARARAGWGDVLVFLAVGLAYLPALRGGLVWDDDAHVTKPALQSWHGLGRIWFELGATQQYYPMLHSAFWVEHRLWGDAAWCYHLTNLLLHATSACLFARVLRRLAIPGAGFAALLFAVHPVMAESVAWISEQKNTLSTVFYLLAALAYLRFDRGEGAPNGESGEDSSARRPAAAYLLALALFILALLTKTVTATLPAALLVIFWWRRGRLAAKRDVYPLVPWLGLGAAAGLFSAWIERRYIGAHGAAFDLDPFQRCLVAARAFWFYLGKLFWPENLIFIYPHWRISAAEGKQELFLFAAVALAAALWVTRRRTRAPLAAFLFFVGTLFPALGFFNVYPFVFSYVADHFQYLASLGIIALVAASWDRIGGGDLMDDPPSPAGPAGPPKPWRGRRLRRAAQQVAAGAVLCSLTTLTWRQCLLYRNAETLYRATLERNPASWLAHLQQGNILWESGQADQAISHYQQAALLNPNYADTHFDLGKALMQTGNVAGAAAQFSEVVRINPSDAEARNNLGIEWANLGRMTEAVAQFEESLRLKPDNAKAHNNLGVALQALGRTAEAEAQFRQAAAEGGGR